MKFQIDVKYKIGDVLESESKTWKVVGYEIIHERIRYICLSVVDDKTHWDFMYDFEIEAIAPSKKRVGFKVD